MILGDSPRNIIVATIGEFVGTFLFLFFSFATVQTASQPQIPARGGNDPSKLLYISLGFGLSLAVNVWIFFRVSGGLFNPAVTLSLCVVGAVPVIRGAFVVVAQLAGGIVASIVVKYIIPGDQVLFAVSLGTGVTTAQGFFIELLLTFQLVITILMLAAEKTKATFVAPLGIGISLFIGHLVGVFWTGAGINPARAFGPQVALLTFPGYHWIYWIGPIVGALLASLLYTLLKLLHYEDVNGDQDKCDDDASLLEAQADRLESVFRRYGPPAWRNSTMGMQVGARARPKVNKRDTADYLRLYRLSELDAYKYDGPMDERQEYAPYTDPPDMRGNMAVQDERRRLSGISERTRSS